MDVREFFREKLMHSSKGLPKPKYALLPRDEYMKLHESVFAMASVMMPMHSGEGLLVYDVEVVRDDSEPKARFASGRECSHCGRDWQVGVCPGCGSEGPPKYRLCRRVA